MNVAKQTYNFEKEPLPKSNPQQKREKKEQQILSLTTNYQRSGLQTTSEANWMPEHPDCLSCGENINHPICPNCIAKAFLQWTKKFPEHHELRGKLNVFMKYHNHVKGKSKKCVSCGKNVHVCPYCFTEYLYSLIKEAGLGVRAMSEFLFIFNFDFEHKGYSKELEVYGGY